MSRNGSGIYNLPVNSWNPAVNGNSATAADWQSLIDDVESALTQSVSSDGQTPITGNLNLYGNKLTSLGPGTASGDSLRFQQLFSQGVETDIASSATVDIGAQNTNFLRVTGTTTITSFGTNYNGPRFIRFADSLILTNSASLLLPGGADITTTAGDRAIIIPTATSGTADGWQVVAYQRADGKALVSSLDYLNTTRIDVASAATVDLTANAPNTRNINVTGTTTITAFTVAVGQTYFVRFNASLTLTNNSAIVTQTGANIDTQAGDTCILRATAANTVEILSYVGYATQSQRGVIELASSAEAQALSDSVRAITPSTLAAALQGSNQSMASNGYQKLPGGLILQWGTTANLGQSATLNVTLPLTFPTAILNAIGIMRGPADSGVTEAAVSVTPDSTSSISISKGTNAAGSGTARPVSWFAIGY